MNNVQRIAGVILRDNTGKYLLVQEKNPKVYGKWNIPAGYVDDGETPVKAAVREAAEEVGLQVELISDEPMYEYFNETKHKGYFAFIGNVIGGEIKPDSVEILSTGWKSFTEISELNASHEIREPWIMEALTKVENQ